MPFLSIVSTMEASMNMYFPALPYPSSLFTALEIHGCLMFSLSAALLCVSNLLRLPVSVLIAYIAVFFLANARL